MQRRFVVALRWRRQGRIGFVTGARQSTKIQLSRRPHRRYVCTGCDHVASEPDKVVKRCVNRKSDDGVWAYEACPKTCGTCGTLEYKNWGFQSSNYCYSELNDNVGRAKSVGECWDMCEAEYGQSLVAIDRDRDWTSDNCYCQDDCQCLFSGPIDYRSYVATRRSITELPPEC